MSNTEKDQEIAASKAGMDPKTARKYLGLSQLPSEVITVRHWRTREDPFSGLWEQVRQQIEENPGLEAKTLFEWLQQEHPGRYQDGSTSAPTAGIAPSPSTPAATGIARSASPIRVTAGWKRAAANCCRSRMRMWCSPCRANWPRWRCRTRARSSG